MTEVHAATKGRLLGVKPWLRAIIGNPLTISVATIVIILATWHAVTAASVYPDFVLPSPGQVFNAFTTTVSNGYGGQSLGKHFSATMSRVGIAYVLACVSGTFLGLAMGMFGKVRATFDPFIEFYRPLPPLAYLVLLIIWLGVGELSKIILLYLTALPPITIGAAAAVKSVRVERINGASSLGANRWQVFRYVILPSCLPGIFTGMRISFAWTYGTVVAAEMIAANSGLGWMVLHAQRYLRTDVIFMTIFLMAFTGIVLEQMLRWAQAKFVPWAGRA
jgi:taurine transport system permease protein